jgi:hypothetical protein
MDTIEEYSEDAPRQLSPTQLTMLREVSALWGNYFEDARRRNNLPM